MVLHVAAVSAVVRVAPGYDLRALRAGLPMYLPETLNLSPKP